jgi:hypothetical protein
MLLAADEETINGPATTIPNWQEKVICNSDLSVVTNKEKNYK